MRHMRRLYHALAYTLGERAAVEHLRHNNKAPGELAHPPHAGVAPGVDRIVMLLCEQENLREVVMFPKDQQARDLMMNAPGTAENKHLRELHIRMVVPEEKK